MGEEFDRRAFIRLAWSLGLAFSLDACLDSEVPPAPSPPGAPPPPLPVPHYTSEFGAICDQLRQVNLGDVTVTTHPWPNGLDAAALIDVDDFCPVYLPGEGLDFGGNLSGNGILKGFLVDQLLLASPGAKICLMTIANMRQDPLTNSPIAEDDRFLLSRQGSWVREVNSLLGSFPAIRLGLHGYWHYNYLDHSAREFFQYGERAAWNTMATAHREALEAFPGVEPVFRAPGWGASPTVLRYVAKAGLLLADSSATDTYDTSVPSCRPLPDDLRMVRGGPDFERVIAAQAARGELIVGHFHFTAPNANSLGAESDLGRRNALGFARAIDGSSTYRIGWLSYAEAGRAVAVASETAWGADLTGTTLSITLENGGAASSGVTLAVTGLGGRDVLVWDEVGGPIPFAMKGSARGLDYIVLNPGA